MKIKEVIVPQLQGSKFDEKNITKGISEQSIIIKKYNKTYLCSEEGFYRINNGKINECFVTVHNSYCIKKFLNVNGIVEYKKVPYNKIDNEQIFINEITEYNIPTNTIPHNHTLLQYEQSILKLNKKSNLELIIEDYHTNDIPNKVYFHILNDFSLDSKIIKDELNVLISFLQQ